MKSRNIILSLALMGCTAANALTLQQAKKLYSEGEFGKALSTFQGLVKKNPGNASYNQWYGACLYETGRKAEARKYIETAYNKRVTDAARYMRNMLLRKWTTKLRLTTPMFLPTVLAKMNRRCRQQPQKATTD